MRSLVAKEIRLLLPAYVLALLLAITPVWLLSLRSYGNFPILGAALPGFGALILALSSFGREFGMGTFSLLLAQPLPRGRIWWTKITVLSCALATVCGLFFLSCLFSINFDLFWLAQWREIAAKLGFATLVILASGLWAALLLRQMLAAFWMALLIPAAILIMAACEPETVTTAYLSLGLYSIVAFGWAWRHFLRAQEVPWTGGAITLPGWQSLDVGARNDGRARRPIAALLRKEIQLYQVALMGMAGLFLLHLGIMPFCKTNPALGQMSPLDIALEMFGVVWFIVPLLTAGLGVAEERRLGTLEGQLCLPVSTRAQFAIKLFFALAFCGGLNALLIWTAEAIADTKGVGTVVGGIKSIITGTGLPTVSAIFIAIALVTFYASTLTRNFLQAMAVAAGTGMVLGFAWMLAGNEPEIAGVQLWGKPILAVISWSVMVVTIILLAGGNFRRWTETRRLWIRNARGIVYGMLFSAALAAAVYNRAWEFFTPLEPAHGPVRLSASQPPVINPDFSGTVTVQLPDGRFWQDFIFYDYGRTRLNLAFLTPPICVDGKWIHQGGGQSATGSNWISVAANYHENVAIQSDGTLWVSEMPTERLMMRGNRLFSEPRANMTRVGSDTDWKKVVRGPDRSSMLILKTNGTLWHWPGGSADGSGSNPNSDRVTLLRTSSEPHELTAGSDWVNLIAGSSWSFAWDKNGRASRFFTPSKLRRSSQILLNSQLAFERFEGFDNIEWRGLAKNVGVRADGTLWNLVDFDKVPVRIGPATDWVSIAAGTQMLVGAKRDGTLWQLHFNYEASGKKGWTQAQAPTRLGSRNDWVAVGSCNGAIVSLSADGSLWYWWRSQPSGGDAWLASSRKPDRIENIFDQQ